MTTETPKTSTLTNPPNPTKPVPSRNTYEPSKNMQSFIGGLDLLLNKTKEFSTHENQIVQAQGLNIVNKGLECLVDELKGNTLGIKDILELTQLT